MMAAELGDDVKDASQTSCISGCNAGLLQGLGSANGGFDIHVSQIDWWKIRDFVADIFTPATLVEHTSRMLEAGASVINWSFGEHKSGVLTYGGGEVDVNVINPAAAFGSKRFFYEKFLGKIASAYPEAIVVIGAGNGATEVTEDTAIPSGIEAESTVVVGAHTNGGVSPVDTACFSAASSTEPYRVSYSDYGEQVDILAAGNVRTSYGQEWKGTSFATPLVAATIATMKSIKPELTASEALHLLRKTGLPVEPAVRRPQDCQEVGVATKKLSSAKGEARPDGGCFSDPTAQCEGQAVRLNVEGVLKRMLYDLTGDPIAGVTLTDLNLQICVGVASEAEGWNTLQEFAHLACVAKGVTSLDGLERFKSLLSLDLSNNQITDVSALRGLTQLQQLVLTGNDGIRCASLDNLEAALTSTVIVRPDSCVGADSNFLWPVAAPNLPMPNPYAAFDVIGNGMYHTGFDLTSSTGNTTVYAAAAGVVRAVPNGTFTNANHGMGNVIIIDHNNGEGPFTLYAHLASIDVPDGETVAGGDPIGVMGNTGCGACGVHLHFEVKRWDVLGNLDDDAGPYWGYTPNPPNLHGYLNPWPYLDHGLSSFTPTAVRSAADQVVRTGPGGEYTLGLGNVSIDQRLVATQQVGDWFEIDFPSEHGPGTGWIQAAVETGVARRKVDDPGRGIVGVSVCPTPSACSGLTPPARLSYVWDEQRLVELEQIPAQHGCASAWTRTSLLNSATGWVCGDYLNTPNQGLASPLNDTGITWGGSYPSGNNATCTSNGTIAAPQDCNQGRDATHDDDSDGHAGFSFTKLGANGTPLAIQNGTWDEAGSEAAGTKWSCVRDNVTGMWWEVKTGDGSIHDKDNSYRWGGKTALGSGYGTYYSDWDSLVDGSNTEALCGYSDWRVPTIKELENLVSRDRINPAIDTDYFPNTAARGFWSSSPYAGGSTRAWYVYFAYGYSDSAGYGNSHSRFNQNFVRLVRSGE